MNPHVQRGSLLFEQGRHELAAEELRLALLESPDDGHARALLALCLAEAKEYGDAEAEARAAVAADPGAPFPHYALACVRSGRNDPMGALGAIREALRLDPGDPDYLAFLAGIQLHLGRTEEALASAGEALAADPAHVSASNLRAMALVRLGRRAEAGATLEASLARDPGNSSTHANRGWALLHEGKPREALGHFQESLRLDPGNDWARAGVVEAIKARNPLYAALLRYLLWMGARSRGIQWALILGAFAGYRVLLGVAESVPALHAWVGPIEVAYVAIVWLTWSAAPLSNLLLRLNRHGRLALSPEQLGESNWIGLVVAVAAAFLAAWLATGRNEVFLLAAGVAAFLVIPVKSAFNCQAGWPRRVMAAYAGLMALLGFGALAAIVAAAVARPGRAAVPHGAIASLQAYMVALVLAGWVGNALAMVRVRR